MAWTSPRTWTTGEVVRARYFNGDVRDNSRVLSGVYAETTPDESTSSTSFGDLATVGPQVIADVGAAGTLTAFWGAAGVRSNAANIYGLMAIQVDHPGGSIAPTDDVMCGAGQNTVSRTSTVMQGHVFTTLTQGIATITAKYRASGASAFFAQRWLLVYAAG